MENVNNKKRLGKLAILLLICTLLFASLSGCLSSCGMLGGEYLAEFMDELFVSMLDDDAISINILLSNPTELGIEDADAKLPLPETKLEAYRESMSALNEIGSYLLNFNYNSLSTTQKCDYDTLMNYFSVYARYSDYYYLQDSYLGSSSGWNSNLPLYLDKFALRNKHDIENWLSLVEQTYTAFPKYVAFEQARIDAGYGRGDAVYEGIKEQAEGMATVEEDETHYLITLFSDKLSDCSFLTDAEKADYNTKCQTAINDKLIPAYSSLAVEIAKFIGNTTNNNNGLCYYDNGKSYYELLFCDYASTDDDVNEAYVNLENAYNNTILRIRATVSLLNNKGLTDEQVSTRVTELSKNPHLSMTDIEGYYTSLQTSYVQDFPALPASVPAATFKEVPSAMSGYYNPASYFKSAVDSDSAEESIYVNSANGGGNIGFDVISHEGLPGHQLQHAYYKTSGANKLRTVLGYSGYAEGWATYAQYYAAKYYSDDEVENAIYKLFCMYDELSLYMVTMMDMDVNYFGLSKAELVEKYYAFTSNSDGIERTFDYVAENPAVYSSYGYGYYKMSALRSAYAGSDLAFHTAVLTIGPTSFEILAKYV